mmetsp:Transcript_61027/g.127930  ORF Transcript_61027/g.127930 Transcript_61027/m.127930 type:complete len:193 (-) Transcript_61027:9-587(-)
MGVNWKLLVTPFMVYCIHSADIDWTDGVTLLMVRIFFGISTIVSLLSRLWIYRIVDSTNDERRVKIKPSTKFNATTGAHEVTVTEHDMEQLGISIRTLLVSTAVTIGLHLYHSWVLPVIIQAVHQPIALWDSPLFQIHVLGLSDSGDHNPLKRPWTQSTNGFEDIWKQAQMFDPKRREAAKAEKKKGGKLRR